MKTESTRGRLAAAAFALASTLIAALGVCFLVIQSVFPWMTVLNPVPAAPPAVAAPAAPTDVATAGPTAAQRVIDQVMATSPGGVFTEGWAETSTGTGMPGVSFGLGCEPTDGLAPVVARTRTWVQTPTSGRPGLARGAVTVSARAFPAGGGAVALGGLISAVVACEEATATIPEMAVGIQSIQVTARQMTAVVWRRGDVLMVATVQAEGRAGPAQPFAPMLTRYDRVLHKALAGVCPDERSEPSDGVRSPYLNRAKFVGLAQDTRVVRDRSPHQVTAEDRTFDPVVPIPAPDLSLTEVGTRPAAPVPAPTTGPTRLPAPRTAPTAPVAPVPAKRAQKVPRMVADPVGPGCGWAFTGQVAPRFDRSAADAAYRAAVETAKRDLTAAWNRWQNAKLAYYGAYATHLAEVEQYNGYAEQVHKIAASWAVIEEARAAYAAALADYEAAVAAREQWWVRRADARQTYRKERKACRNRAGDSPAPASPVSPSAAPSQSPSPTGSLLTPTPAGDPLVCPPVRSAILDQDPPRVPRSPVPAPEAQLPTPDTRAR